MDSWRDFPFVKGSNHGAFDGYDHERNHVPCKAARSQVRGTAGHPLRPAPGPAWAGALTSPDMFSPFCPSLNPAQDVLHQSLSTLFANK